MLDVERGGSLSIINEDISFTDLVGVVLEYFGINGCGNSVKIRYALPDRTELPLMFIRNDRQLRAFMNKFVESGRGISYV